MIYGIPMGNKHEIDALTRDFFRAVSFTEGNKPAYQNLYKLFIESGQLIKNSSSVPEISTVSQFIEPRQRMVDSGELTCFKEVETAEITEMFGNIAHRFSTYEKYGINQGTEFEGRGAISHFECPECLAVRDIHPKGEIMKFPWHPKRVTSPPNHGVRWVKRESAWVLSE